MSCIYHCESEWLPLDGVLDEVDELKLMETEVWTACHQCNDAAFLNYDMDEEYEDTSDLTRSMLKGGQ